MAAFCAACGARVAASMKYCSECGAPLNIAAPGYAATPAPPLYRPAPAGVLEPQRSGGAWKTILIVVAIVALLAVIGIGAVGLAAWRISRRVHVQDNGDSVTVSVPGGATVSAGGDSGKDAELDVPVYPGAVREQGGIQLRSMDSSMVMAHFATADPLNEVVAYYKGKLGTGVDEVTASSDGSILTWKSEDGKKVTITISRGHGEDAGKTSIMILRAKKIHS